MSSHLCLKGVDLCDVRDLLEPSFSNKKSQSSGGCCNKEVAGEEGGGVNPVMARKVTNGAKYAAQSDVAGSMK